ncbi:hypothetical protein GOP47_0009581 [Adiantum capillus-veneris]|uniref:Protein TIC 40, chloroplastic n=1 Tax=Adiantum capillus-veneris TaxID=13818 RepID=A0A9D4ZJT1_ADICA|nr:hypothetical protein GOP47_0009581 [Adiantum capillus-veneris]
MQIQYGDVHCKAQHSSSGTSSQTTSVATPPPFPPPQPQIGSPLLWIGVGVGISIVFSWAARRVQGYAMQQALKSMMQQTGQGGSSFGTGPGSNPFSGPGMNPFAGMAPGTFSSSPSGPASSAATTTVDVTPQSISPVQSEVQVAADKPSKIRKSAFTDVDVGLLDKEEAQVQEQFSQRAAFQKPSVSKPEVVDGTASFSGASTSGSEASSTGNGGTGKSFISIEMLETMLDDPKIQQMVFPYLPAEMRDPATFKQMIQLPQVRQQLQEALNNMGGEDGLDMLKYMNSDVVKQQFEQIGLKPEEVVGKILASPDIAASLQNPKVVEAIMDCSQNPLNITKYQNDKEVMNALMKIAELFPAAQRVEKEKFILGNGCRLGDAIQSRTSIRSGASFFVSLITIFKARASASVTWPTTE